MSRDRSIRVRDQLTFEIKTGRKTVVADEVIHEQLDVPTEAGGGARSYEREHTHAPVVAVEQLPAI
jgi:hypothetical protein